ncbi:imidazoleglycerol-phosphate dehydratase HisB [Spirochaeta dissipatitropha]
MSVKAAIDRETKETSIHLELSQGSRKADGVQPVISIETGIPFMDHMLHAFAFHGDWNLKISASGDIHVDPHHLVEDLGIVLGQAIQDLQAKIGIVQRYGHCILSMDDALGEATVDLCNRPYLVFNAVWPQSHIGQLDTCLFREFFYALAANARCNIHLNVRYGENSHHIIESLFKSLGIAMSIAATELNSKEQLSTKGTF